MPPAKSSPPKPGSPVSGAFCIESPVADMAKAQGPSGAELARPLAVGDRLPDFTLPDHHGHPFNLEKAARAKPQVLIFYRGDWCPYCNGQLASYARKYEEFIAQGADIVAVAVDTVAQNAEMVEKLLIPFPILSDSDPEGEVIRSAGVWDESGLIARPAILLLDRDRQMHYMYVGIDYVDRPGDDQLFAAVDGLAREGDSSAPR